MSERTVLTLKYRPQTFDELLVQDHVRDTLKRAIDHRRFANAYLFAGPRGVGKTTTARILAKSLNCLSFDAPTTTPCNTCGACIEITQSRSMDVLEIDGASNRGIDQVRELRENIKYTPSSLRFKVYIIDEVHMLTDQAFNALLKTLEEPPAHAKFVFATTAAHKVPATIISRCQRFDFRKATPDEITGRLRTLADAEKMKVTDAALAAIARRADGAIRDGESVLEQLATYRPEGIEVANVQELLGLVPGEQFFEYVDRVLDGDAAGLLTSIDELTGKGYDLREFLSGLVGHVRNLVFACSGGPMESVGLLPDERRRLDAQAARLDRTKLIRMLETVLQTQDVMRHSPLPRVQLEYLSLELAARLGTEKPDAPEPRKPRARKSPGNPGPAAKPGKTGPAPAGTEEDDHFIKRLRKVVGEVEEERQR